MFREDLSRNFGFILNDVARLLRTSFDRRVKQFGLTRSQWWVLTFLFRNDGVTQSELADTLEIEKPTLGRLIDRLEAKGWVRREPDASDRRAWRVRLTDETEPAMKTMRAIAAEVRRDALAGLSVEERERFVDTLLMIKANLGSIDNGPSGNGAARNGGDRNRIARNGARARRRVA
jgi:DNA-binding MarR family transcriptional regulator